jgi:opacity protein-like surface antigen
MKSFIGGMALTALLSVPAIAADVAVKAPTYNAASITNWTGAYAGLELGGKWGDAT